MLTQSLSCSKYSKLQAGAASSADVIYNVYDLAKISTPSQRSSRVSLLRRLLMYTSLSSSVVPRMRTCARTNARAHAQQAFCPWIIATFVCSILRHIGRCDQSSYNIGLRNECIIQITDTTCFKLNTGAIKAILWTQYCKQFDTRKRIKKPDPYTSSYDIGNSDSHEHTPSGKSVIVSHLCSR